MQFDTGADSILISPIIWIELGKHETDQKGDLEM